MRQYQTKQEVFDVVWNGLKAQNWERAINATTGQCRYRGDNDRKCAIGLCISDELASKWEGAGIECQLSNFPEDVEAVFGPNVFRSEFDLILTDDQKTQITLTFLADLQDAHDRKKNYQGVAAKLEEEMRKFADEYKLTIPE